MPHLILETGEKIDLETIDPLILGRAGEQCDIVIPDESISRNHAKIGVTPEGKYFVGDLGSTNGTFLNGEKLPTKKFFFLEEKDQIKFGNINTSVSFNEEHNDLTKVKEHSNSKRNQDSLLNSVDDEKQNDPSLDLDKSETLNSYEKKTVASHNFQYAGFWQRVLAYVIDLIFLLLLNLSLGLALSIVFVIFDISLDVDLVVNTLGIIIGSAYFIVMESSPKQGTIGKMMRGLKVSDHDGNRISILRATGRYFGKLISSIFFIGYFIMLFSSKKQCLHDMMTSCLVIRKSQ
ncbi:MAG: RDD family protein [Candidatus Caenarcaniphilales bacterium]|nr:RDD family protein [Candidatus Caenarcaniphilales bacterium]